MIVGSLKVETEKVAKSFWDDLKIQLFCDVQIFIRMMNHLVITWVTPYLGVKSRDIDQIGPGY
jgi:hypothetical protein